MWNEEKEDKEEKDGGWCEDRKIKRGEMMEIEIKKKNIDEEIDRKKERRWSKRRNEEWNERKRKGEESWKEEFGKKEKKWWNERKSKKKGSMLDNMEGRNWLMEYKEKEWEGIEYGNDWK